MLVFILIAALGFLYYATVQRSTAHLIARNFVHLNEVSEVLAETIEVMKQVTRFADYYCSEQEIGNDTGQCLTDRLVASSPYVTERNQISLGDQQGSPGTAGGASRQQSSILVTNAGVTISWEPRSGGAAATLTVPFRNIEGLANSVQYYDTLMIAEDSSGDVYFDSAKLDLHAEPGKPDSYFFDSGSYERYNTIDALVDQWLQMNAPANSKAEDGNEKTREKETPAGKKAAFPQSTIVPVKVGGVDYLGFVQPVSSPDLGSQKLYVIGMVREADFNSDRFSVPLSTYAISLLFIVVLMLSLSLIRIVLIEENGVVGRRDIYVLLGSALGLVSLLALVVMSLATWRDLSRSQDEDLNLIADSMNAGFQDEIYRKLVDMSAVEEYVNNHYSDLQSIRSLQESDDGKANELPSFFADTEGCELASLSCAAAEEKDALKAALCKKSNKSLACKARRLPPFASLFTLDSAGDQRGLYVTVRNNPIKSAFNLASRGYFQRTLNDNLWTLHPPEKSEKHARSSLAETQESPQPIEFYLDRIKSRSTGELETVLVTEASREPGWWRDTQPGDTGTCSRETGADPGGGSECQGMADQSYRLNMTLHDQAKPIALVAITGMRSLEEAVLPPGFGYLVIESTTGKVLYHQDQDRSLLENFYDVIGHDLGFKTHIATGLPGVLNLTYKGDAVRANVQSVASLPLSIVTYYKFQPVRTLIFQFSVSAFLLVLLFLVYQFVVLMLLERLVHYFFGPPTRSRESPVKPMWQLNIALGVVALGYLFAGFLVEDWQRIAIVLLGPFLIYGVARVFGARFLVWVMSGPSRVADLWHQNPVLGARWTAFFLSLLLGVLPAITIFYESMSLHEYSWRRFNNWSESHSISSRTDFFTDSIAQLAYKQSPSPSTSISQALANGVGIYLPNTRIWAPSVVSDAGAAIDCERGATMAEIPGYIESSGAAKTRLAEISIWCNGRASPTSGELDKRRLIQSVLAWIPDLTLMRSMLERFSEAQNSSLSKVDSCQPDEAAIKKPDDHVDDQSYNFCWQIADRQRQLHYMLKAFYPHRKYAGGDYHLPVLAIYAVFLLFLWLAGRGFLNMIAPIRLIQEIRSQAGNDFTIAPPNSRSFYTVIPAQVGEHGKRDLIKQIEVQYKLEPLHDDLIGPFLSAREEGEYTIAMLHDLDALLDGHPAERLVREWLLRMDGQGKLCLLVVSRLDVGYLRTRQSRGEVLLTDGADDWELLLTGIICVPFHKFTAGTDGSNTHRSRPEKFSGDDTLLISAHGYRIEPREYYRQWELSSDDEKIALAGLAHHGVTNVANVPSLLSLYSRGIITVAPLGINFRVPSFGDYVKKKFNRAQFKVATAGYHDDKWRIFRAPLYILLGAVALFVAYSVQDELSNVVTVFGGFGATLGLIRSIGERYRNTLAEE